MIQSMTGFAARQGAGLGYSWVWELRSVNGKGLDIRLRLPDWVPGLEQPLREALAARVARGNVNLSLRLARDEAARTQEVNAAHLAMVLSALRIVSAEAEAQGVPLAGTSAADILAMRGVLDVPAAEDDGDALRRALLADAGALIDAFVEMRAAEGAALGPVLGAQVDRIEALTRDAAACLPDRRAHMASSLRAALDRISGQIADADESRVAQELAMIAVKADVTEEIDRLRAHIEAARALLTEAGPIGRKLDFLTQEFNREANTLCSKAQFAELTRIGLDLKTVIDQMREQVQNVE